MTNDRTVHMVVIHDPNSAESRKLMDAIAENNEVTKLELQRVQKILPGIRAVPAVGVLIWASDLQGLASDVNEFAAYINNEAEIVEALKVQGVMLNEE